MKVSFVRIFKKPINYISVLIGSILVFFMLRIVPVYEILHNSYKIPGLSSVRKIQLFIEYTVGNFFTGSLQEQFIAILLSFLIMINLILFISFYKRQRKILSGKSLIASASGMLLGLFGVGCLSCGVLIMAPLLTFIGLGTYLNTFTEHAVIIAYTGIFFVIVSILFLLKKISEPLICK